LIVSSGRSAVDAPVGTWSSFGCVRGSGPDRPQAPKKPVVAGFWWLALLVLGNLAAAIYLVRASFASADVSPLFTGRSERRL
jgi:hypothetical protein